MYRQGGVYGTSREVWLLKRGLRLVRVGMWQIRDSIYIIIKRGLCIVKEGYMTHELNLGKWLIWGKIRLFGQNAQTFIQTVVTFKNLGIMP